jgi:hypothetical protein
MEKEAFGKLAPRDISTDSNECVLKLCAWICRLKYAPLAAFYISLETSNSMKMTHISLNLISLHLCAFNFLASIILSCV